MLGNAKVPPADDKRIFVFQFRENDISRHIEGVVVTCHVLGNLNILVQHHNLALDLSVEDTKVLVRRVALVK